MATLQHSYGPTCLLSDRSSTSGAGKDPATSDSPPAVRTQFFYTSAVPIDDPLSPLPPPSSSSSTAPPKHPPRPFSAFDNAALEEAWQHMLQVSVGSNNASRERDANSDRARVGKSESAKAPEPNNHGFADEAVSAPFEQSSSEQQTRGKRKSADTTDRSDTSRPLVDGDGGINHDLEQTSGLRSSALPPQGLNIETHEDGGVDTIGDSYSTTVKGKGISRANGQAHLPSPRATATPESPRVMPAEGLTGVNAIENDITGNPFIRAPSRSERTYSPTGPSRSRRMSAVSHSGSESEDSKRPSSSRRGRRRRSDIYRPRRSMSRRNESPEIEIPRVSVPVGVSRLHLVMLPDFQMKPIYWSPVHDISSVVRATWFFRKDMSPVDSALANRLEAGYLELRPWTQTWNDELNSAVEVGAEGEAKVVHKLWPEESEPSLSRPGTAGTGKSMAPPGASQMRSSTEEGRKGSDPAIGSSMAASGPEIFGVDTDNIPPKTTTARLYRNASVLYANSREAYILRPNLLPSAYYRRKPLTSIHKGGKPVGVPVIRGFDWRSWEALHPAKNSGATAKAYQGATQPGASEQNRPRQCQACWVQKERPKVSDLILVIHGIGQKLSERVESFHFTHAINDFRRRINVELGAESDAMKNILREDIGGIMVLPINWRSTVSFEDDNGAEGNTDPTKNDFSLEDITPNTIPAVRNLISDVMLDIPYYLSHHRPKMIEAVIKESNRVYRLWCKNNPGFQTSGRVHLLAHSLGSAMAIDILSTQPTKLPKQMPDFSGTEIDRRHFEFDTKNLFLCGSPAGFFLLLNRATLIPRKGRNKPGADGEDIGRGIAGEAGTYGCVAVDNIYNVLHYNDPIAYRLNATVDADYAASVKDTRLPTFTSSWLSPLSLFSSKKSQPLTSSLSASDASRPEPSRLPSTIELETHDFTHEEVAEKKFILLNDNLTIDFYLPPRSGVWPLEIQYLNMLGAHSSYWVSTDFVRFLVIEIGRTPGRAGALSGLRALKKGLRR
ncbi:MAG: hypothetical protein M1819_001463 [Sarea resinae]|nr:MAG: hypothetical protein M1819_001463 [Sarea resinae]